MEKQRRDRYRYGDGSHATAKSPSFSSTLLDEICRSIDDNGSNGTTKPTNYASSFSTKTATTTMTMAATTSISDLQRASTTRRNSVNSSSMSSNSSSSSSDSSSKRGESQSRYSSSCYSIKRPKPIRTSSVSRPEDSNTVNQTSRFERNQQAQYTNGAVQESNFTKKKSKALKIYGDLKRIKQQPISPGARLASFLNSLLGSPKKTKFSNSKPNHAQNGNQNHNYYNETYRSTPSSSTCSSATSFSRSCFSKTPSSGAKPDGITKRTVRFYPVSVIVDEESRPCGHKNVYKESRDNGNNGDRHREEINFEAARELWRKYQVKKKENSEEEEEDEEEDEDDGGSCASSDLFELDNLSVFELPVYETTNIQIPTNRAIF